MNANNANETILEVVGLKKHFPLHKRSLRKGGGAVRAVDGVSFSVHTGETLGLVGESGSGKSTVAYTLLGVYKATAGEIRFDGETLRQAAQRNAALRRKMQIVFQDPGSSLNPRRSIKQTLELPLRIHQLTARKERLRKIAELLEMVELPADYMFKHPHALSGGQKQRIAIARALAVEPSLIVLDEPTSALDVSVQGKIISLLLELQKQFDLTYLFISHDLSLMRNVASRVAVMYLGKISEIAPTVELFENPHHPYTQMLLSAIPVVSKAEEKLKPDKVPTQGEIPSPALIPTGCSFHPRCPYAIEACKRKDPEPREVSPDHLARCHLYEGRIAVPESIG